MSTRSRYREECGHCTHVAHSVSEMEKHLKTHAEDKILTEDRTGSTHQASEDEQSESDSDVCIRPDPEPEAETDNCLWEEWEADNVTFNYPRDVDDPNFEHHMGSCDTDMQHFRNLYHDSLSDGGIEDPATQPESPVNKSEGTSQNEASPNDLDHTADDALSGTDGPDEKPASTPVRYIGAEQDYSGQEISAHLSDHQYSTPVKRPSVEAHSQRKHVDSEHTSNSDGEGLHLTLTCSEESDGEHISNNNFNKAFSCAHCDFTSSVLSTVQQHTMNEHSEVPKADIDSATWECVDETAMDRTDEQSDWQMVPDDTERDSDDDGPTPIEVAPIDDHNNEEERCFKCEVNGCNTLFPLKVDFHNHVKLKHRADGGQIFHCAYCWFAATDPERVKDHRSAAHPTSNQDTECAIVNSDTYLPNIPHDNRIPLVVAPIENYGDVVSRDPAVKGFLNDNINDSNPHSTDSAVLNLGGTSSQHKKATDQLPLSNLNTMIMYECKVNGCPAVFFARDAFSCHVKSEHIYEGGRIFYCAFCRFAATDHVRVKEHALSEHTNGNGQPDLNLTPLQKKHSFKRLLHRTCCLFCKFSSPEPHITVYHTYREHRGVWMSKLEKMHIGFSAVAARLGILSALPLLKVPRDKHKNIVKQGTSQTTTTTGRIIATSEPGPKGTERPLILRGGRRRRTAVNYAHLVNTGGMCEGCDICDNETSSKRQKVQEKEEGSAQDDNIVSVPENSNSPTLKRLSKEEKSDPKSNVKQLAVNIDQKPKAVSQKQSAQPAPLNIRVELSQSPSLDSEQNPASSFKDTATEKSATTEQVTKTLSKLTSLLKKPSSILAEHTVSKGKPPRKPETPANLETQPAAQLPTVKITPKPVVVPPAKPVLTQAQPQVVQPNTANVTKKNNVMNIGVCNRGCTQHQILLLKNNDPNETKVLLLHDFNGKVIHAESLQLSALGISVPKPAESSTSPVPGPSTSSMPCAPTVSPIPTVNETSCHDHTDVPIPSCDIPSDSPLKANVSSTPVLAPAKSPPSFSALQIQDSAVSSTVSKDIKYESIDLDDMQVAEEESVYEAEIDDTPFEDNVEDNAYLYADHEDLHWHGEENESPKADVPFRRLTEDDHVAGTIHSQDPVKKHPKKKRKLSSTAIPMKRPAMKAVQTKELTIQPTRVSTRERKPNLKCLCEDCKLHRMLIGTKLQEGESTGETYQDRLLNDPKLKLKPVVMVPDIMMILLRSR